MKDPSSIFAAALGLSLVGVAPALAQPDALPPPPPDTVSDRTASPDDAPPTERAATEDTPPEPAGAGPDGESTGTEAGGSGSGGDGRDAPPRPVDFRPSETAPADDEAKPATPPPPPQNEAAATTADPLEVARSFTFNPPDSDVRVKPIAEFGALWVLHHNYQGGSDGTRFDLRRDGGQATAFLSWRISAELELYDNHQLVFLYQPIDLRTRATLTGDFRVNGLTFPSGTPMQFRYGFDYYRFSYLYDFYDDPDQELALGLSMQLRVANLEFSSLDGTLQRTSQNLGPVPLIKLRGRYTFDNDVFIGTEIDGIGIRFPSDQGTVLGLFFDTSLRVGYSPTDFAETYLNVRYIGGGAEGPGSRPLDSEFGDGFNNNFIHALNFGVGLAVK